VNFFKTIQFSRWWCSWFRMWMVDDNMTSFFKEHILVRPCVRQNFPNFSFSRVSEKFGCRSSEIFRKKTEFLNSQNCCEKVWKKVQKFKFGKKFGNYSKMYVNFKNFKKVCKVWVFESKKPVFGSKSLDMVRKKFGKVQEKFGNFGKWFFRMFGNFGNCHFLNFPKFTKKWR